VYAITPHAATAIAVAAQHLSQVRPLATPQSASHAAGLTFMIIMALVAAAVVSMPHAARALSTFVTMFLQIAAVMTAALFMIMITGLVIMILLIHH
jgi:hypothetical protein